MTYYRRKAGVWTPLPGTPAPTDPGDGDVTFVLGTTRPDATNTGADLNTLDGTLTGTNGILTLSTTGQTITNKRIEAYVKVTAPNVTLTNCHIVGRPTYSGYHGFSGVVECASTATLIDKCTVAPRAVGYYGNGINGSNFRAYRCDVGYSTDLFSMKGNAVAEGCYVHDQVLWDGANTLNGNGSDHPNDDRFPGWSHNDGFQIYGGSGNRVEGCNMVLFFSPTLGTPQSGIDGHPRVSGTNTNGTSFNNGGRNFPNRNYAHCILTGATQSTITNCVIKNNWFDGGEIGIQVTAQSQGFDTGQSFTITGNRFGVQQKPGYTGNPTTPRYLITTPTTAGFGTFTVTGNVFDDDPTVPAALQGTSIDPYYSNGGWKLP